jgi:hypothetical protein
MEGEETGEIDSRSMYASSLLVILDLPHKAMVKVVQSFSILSCPDVLLYIALLHPSADKAVGMQCLNLMS